MESVIGGIIFFSPVFLAIIGYLIAKKPAERYLANRMRRQHKAAIRDALHEQQYLDELAQEVAQEEGI